MSRLSSCGFELNSTTANYDISTLGSTPSVQSSVVRTGTYALQINSLSSGTRKGISLAAGTTTSVSTLYYRVYFRYATLPSADNVIIAGGSSNLLNNRFWLKISNTGTLQLADGTGNIGSASTALSANTWYRVELEANTASGAGACIVKARLDGTEFAASTTRTFSSANNLVVGGNLAAEAQTTGNWYFDDLCINNTSGSFQNSYPGAGGLKILVPNATGDSASWTRAGADSGANWSQVNEVPYNDATAYVSSTTLNHEDLYGCTSSGIGSGDTVNVVAIGVRFSANSASSVPTFKVECEKTSGGTIAQSAGITPASTAWATNSTAADTVVPVLTLHQDPDAANWTQSTLDSMQIGVKITTDNTFTAYVTALWVYFDYTPSVGGNTVRSFIPSIIG